MAQTLETPPKITSLSKDQLELSDDRWFPELEWDLSDSSLEAAKNMLLQLPLIHRTDVQRFSGEKPEIDTLYDTPVPSSFLPEHDQDNTYKADTEIGLDQYTFMGWGGVLHEDSGDFLGNADYAILIDPSILFDDNCVVSARDIATFLPDNALYDGIVNDAHARESTKLYLDTVVSGELWFEVITRRVAHAIENKERVDLSLEALGEIKYRGPIPRGAIIGAMDIRSNEYEMYINHLDKMSQGTLRLRTANYFQRLVHKVFNMR